MSYFEGHWKLGEIVSWVDSRLHLFQDTSSLVTLIHQHVEMKTESPVKITSQNPMIYSSNLTSSTLRREGGLLAHEATDRTVLDCLVGLVRPSQRPQVICPLRIGHHLMEFHCRKLRL